MSTNRVVPYHVIEIFQHLLTKMLGVYPLAMQLTLNIPDDLFQDVKDKVSALPAGVLESVAMDAVLGFIETLRRSNHSQKSNP